MNPQKLFSHTLCCCLLSLVTNVSHALACHYLVIDLHNYTDYTWTLTSNSACKDPEDPTSSKNCKTNNLHEPNSWEDIVTIPAQDDDGPGTLQYILKDSNNSGPNLHFVYSNNMSDYYQQNLSFDIRASKVECTANCGGGSQSNNSSVSSGKNFVDISKRTKSKEPGFGCTGGHRAYTTFDIYYPTAPKITITLPKVSDPILKQSILEKTYDYLDPGAIKLFDTFLHDPTIVQKNSFTFVEPCTSNSCWKSYCDLVAHAKGCEDK